MGVSWKEGRRIVSLFELAQQLECKACCALLDLRRTEKEERFGLASVLRIVCQCGITNHVHTERKIKVEHGNSSFAINTETPLQMQALSMNVAHMLNFLAIFQVPVAPVDDNSHVLLVSAPPTVMADGTLVTKLPSSSTGERHEPETLSSSQTEKTPTDMSCWLSAEELPPVPVAMATSSPPVSLSEPRTVSTSLSDSQQTKSETRKVRLKMKQEKSPPISLESVASSIASSLAARCVSDNKTDKSNDQGSDDEGNDSLLKVSFLPKGRKPLKRCRKKKWNLKPSIPSNLPPEQIIQKVTEDCEESSAEYTCTVCSAHFTCELDACCHVTVHTGSKELTCMRCGTRFKGDIIYNNIALLEAHINRHNNHCPYECPICGKLFHGNRSLNRHKRSHGDGKNHVCDQCSYRTNCPRSLREHMKTHSDERPFVCEFCGSGFRLKRHMTDHVARVHRQEKRFFCNQCNKAFYTNCALKLHMSTHTRQRNHQCEDCGKSFLRPSNLRTHQRIHKGDKRYKCNVCDARFVQKNSLNWHMKKHGQ